ncbi:MAG TPA: hypothetical protein DET40_05445 [Lentisphaeria bacterium]|nr:MAG: hypothetical protein A2X45_16065 [Lentisphaerae bacterium GWF2_50_93]HCE42972.1 hypothetical protein [Lentisphaeria bacterium]
MLGALFFVYKVFRSDSMDTSVKIASLFGLIAVISFCLLGVLYRTDVVGNYSNDRLLQIESRYNFCKGFVLGKYLAEKYPDRKAMIIVPPDYELNFRQKELVDSIVKGFGDSITLEAIEEIAVDLSRYQKGKSPHIEEIMTAEDFDYAFNKHRDCEVVVSIIGVPKDIEKMRVWGMKDYERPKIALLNSSTKYLESAIKGKYVVASVHYIPGFKAKTTILPSSPEKVFENRYILVTPENVEQIKRQYDKLFFKM